MQTAQSYTLLNIGQGVIITAGLSIGMGLAAKDVSDGKINLGDLVAINAYIIQLYSPLSTSLHRAPLLGVCVSCVSATFVSLLLLSSNLARLARRRVPHDRDGVH